MLRLCGQQEEQDIHKAMDIEDPGGAHNMKELYRAYAQETLADLEN